MNKANKLTTLLRRLNSGENPVKLKKEAQEFLASVEPAELSIAEQKLIEEGLEPADLRPLCSAHMEMLDGELDRFKKTLKPGHVVHTLVSEHEMILQFLDRLEEINEKIQKMVAYSKREEFSILKHIAEHLVEAEPHHKREEDVLFPELDKRGVYGPPQVMRMEHEDLRKKKKELMELAKSASKMDFKTFKKKLDALDKFIVPTLRDHIFKENNILYPMALQVIDDNKVWTRMKSECDRIGYCCFTPSA